MNSLYLRISIWIGCFFIFAQASVTYASVDKNIDIAVSQNGAVTLEISNIPDPEDLSVPRDYRISYSSDLINWVEIGRVSSLDSYSEIRDTERKSNPARFYKAELIEISQPALLQIAFFVEALESHSQFTSGILLEGFALADIAALRESEAELRSKLQALLDQNLELPDGLTKLYYELLVESDLTLASRPLELTVGSTVLEIEVSEAMRIIAEEYQRLGLVSLNDYHRLPGIDWGDLEGLETLLTLLSNRQIGTPPNIPLFNAFSPFGHAVLIDRLVRKFGDILLEKTKDSDNDGKVEIDYDRFRALVNGTLIASREADQLIKQISNANPIPWERLATSPVSNESLETVLRKIQSILDLYESETEELVASKNYELVFENPIRSIIRSSIANKRHAFKTRIELQIKNPERPIELLPEANLISLNSTPKATNLKRYLSELKEWKQSIELSITSFLEDLELSEPLENDFKGILSNKLNGYNQYGIRITGLYEQRFNLIKHALVERTIVFDLSNGAEVEIAIAQHPVLSNLPPSISDLLAYSGIAAAVSEEELRGFHSNPEWNALSQITFSPTEIATSNSLSQFGRIIELYSLLLERLESAVASDGAFDPSAFVRSILLDPELDTLLDAIEQSISDDLDRLDNLDIDHQLGFSKEDYSEILETLESAKQSIRIGADATRDRLAPRIQSTWESALQANLNRLNDKADDLLASAGEALLKVSIDQKSYTVSRREALEILDRQLNRIAVVESPAYPSRKQYSRLNGVGEALALKIRPAYLRDQLRSISLPVVYVDDSDSLEVEASPLDIAYFLLPTLLQTYGQAIIAEENAIDLNLFKQKLLQGLYVPAPDEASIRTHHLNLVKTESIIAQLALKALNMESWDDRLKAETIFESIKHTMIESIPSLIQELDTSEIRSLERDFNNEWTINYAYSTYINPQKNFTSIRMSNDATFTVPIDDIKKIPNFPYHQDYWDKALFSGIAESDMDNSFSTSRRIRYPKPDATNDEDWPQGLNEDKLIVNLLTRYYNESQSLPDSDKGALFEEERIPVEVFRRIIKGVDLLHWETLEFARRETRLALDRMRLLVKERMTLENVLAVYESATDLQEELSDHLSELTFRHEPKDVIEMEEAITAVYKDVIDEMIDYYRSNDLVIDANDASITVPVQQISEALIGITEERFPGEAIGAHHFAAIAGISVEDLRPYNKLEEFFGAQIIALPRNSQYVEIQSKLSEIGFMQLIHETIMRHFDKVVDASGNQVDIEALLALLTDVDLSYDRIETIARSLHEGAISKINAIQQPYTNRSLQEAIAITHELTSETRRRVIDHISHFEPHAYAALQSYLDESFNDFIAYRDSRFIGASIAIESIDRQILDVNLSEIENAVMERFQELILENPLQDSDADQDLFWAGIPSIFPRLPGPIREDFHPDHTLTQLGFHALMARLIRNYGVTVSENNQFSLERFLEELGKPNHSRAEKLFENMKDQAITELEARVPPGEESIPHQDILALHDFLAAERLRFSEAYGRIESDTSNHYDIRNSAMEAWASVMLRYEDLLFDRDFTFQFGNRLASVPTAALVERMHQAYSDGYTQLLDSYVKDGEPHWIYAQFGYLSPIRYPYFDYISNEQASDDTFASYIEAPRYPFSLGELANLPGIASSDLRELETEQNHHIQVAQIPPSELISGQFNMRILSPGSAPQTIGNRLGFLDSPAWEGPIDRRSFSGGFLDLSPRDIRFRLLLELIEDYSEILVDSNGDIDLEAFEVLLQIDL